MKKARDFDNILDECLQRVLGQGETIEQCLARYPEQAAELEPLLQTAAVAKKASAIRPTPEFKDKARYEFRRAIHEVGQEKRHHLSIWQPRWATVAIAVLVLVVAGSGTVAAASNSMPDEPLYPVKLAAETVRVTLTPSPLGKAELYASFADKRVAEIVRMADKGKLEQVERTTEKLDVYLQKVASLAVPAERRPGALMAPAPQAVPAPAPARTPTATPSPAPVPLKTTPAPLAATPSAKSAASGQAKNGKSESAKSPQAEPNKRAKVKEALAVAAARQTEALKAALARAPEPAKAALRRAIAVSEARYRQAIEALEK